ncbi:MAG: SDR family NAD(P)-dependent oxidoreductase [Promethearchaeota archaeon]
MKEKVLITGASKGIGKAIKEVLEKNFKVIPISRTDGFDVNKDLNKIKEIAKEADILINNVGGVGSNPNEWKLALYKNYEVMVELINAYLEKPKKWGRVITISSIYGKEKGHNPGFTASKSAQIAYMKSLAGRFEGITFNTICPGHIDVGKPFPDNPLIIGKPEDIAWLVDFLCTNKASHINGACITVDGGVSHSF